MFKVFNRGQKLQFNERASNSTIDNGNLGLSYDHMRRRNSSIRASAITFNGDTGMESVSSMGHSINLVPKKYVSCDNFAKNDFEEDEYQEVIDEEYDDENGIKEKIVKRYNSLTNLLMRSFRKAKIKKKKEAMLQENMINEVDSSTSLNRQSHVVVDKTNVKHSKNNAKTKRESVFCQDQDVLSIAEENSDDLNDISSRPVYKGSRLISSEFSYDKKNNKTNSLRIKSSNDIINTSLLSLNSNMPNTSKNFNSLRLNSSQLNNEKASIYSAVANKTNKKVSSINNGTHNRTSEKENRPKIKNENQKSHGIEDNRPRIKIENTGDERENKMDILQKFSSHTKPQAPKPPIANTKTNTNDITTPTPTNNNKSEEKTSIDANINASNHMKSMIVKRSKTFTQQLQEMLKDHKTNKQDIMPLNKMNENHQTNSNYSYSSYLGSNNNNNNIKQIQENKSYTPSSMIEEKESMAMRNNTTISQTMSHMTNSLVIDSNNRKHDISQDYLDFLDENSFLINNDPIKSINDFNRIQIEANNLDDNDDNNIDETESKSNASCDKDEFKDLIQVLAGQEPEFKNKFFNCLMTKLWDTSLPLEEYVQLNKLLTALFGENYHKMDFEDSRSIKKTKIDYLNLKSTKNSKLDAEYIVNLMKVYLDSKSNKRKIETKKETVISSRENLLDDTSISHLINSLRVRQRNESSTNLSRIMPRSSNFNLISSDTYDLEDKIQQFKNEFSFRNGFNGLANNESTNSKTKSSIVLKVDGEELSNQNFINHSVIQDYSNRSIVLDQHKKSVQSLLSSDENSSYQFTRDSKTRKTLMNYERSFITAALAKNANNNNEANKTDELKNSTVKNEKNKITKILLANRPEMSSPISYYNSKIDKSTNSINNIDESLNNTSNKLSLSNISDISSSKQQIEIHYKKNTSVKSHGGTNVASFQPFNQEIQFSNTCAKKSSENNKIQKPTYNVVRTVVQPPKPKLAPITKSSSPSNQDIIIKQKHFKVVNIFKNVNENILNIKHSPNMANSSSMRKRDGQLNDTNMMPSPYQINREQTEAIYQVQRVSKKFESDLSNAVFNPNEIRSPRTAHTYVYLDRDEHQQQQQQQHHRNAKISNQQLNEEYHKHFMKKKCYEYTYEPVKKVANHQLKDLMTEKIYRLERKEMLQAFY